MIATDEFITQSRTETCARANEKVKSQVQCEIILYA